MSPTDENVPADGVNVSGDNSDIEIVIMDSSDEGKSQEEETRVPSAYRTFSCHSQGSLTPSVSDDFF